MRIAGVENRLRPLASLLRVVALGVIAALLLVRLGPICEAAARAAPIAPTMSGCEGKGSGTPENKASLSACATPCTAVPGEALARVEPITIPAVAPWPAPLAGLTGAPIPPATPPPDPCDASTVSHNYSTELLMTKLKLIGTALALALPTAAFAADAACCCGADRSCCKEGSDCCKGKDGDHAGHDMPGAPKK